MALNDRFTRIIAQALAGATTRDVAEAAIKDVLPKALNRHQKAEEMQTPKALAWVIAKTLAALPDAFRFEMRAEVFNALATWLPERGPLRAALIVVEAFVEENMKDALEERGVSAKALAQKIEPVIARAFTNYNPHPHAPEEGDGDPMDNENDKADEKPTFATARVKLETAGPVVDRLMLIGTDENRKVIVFVVTQTPTEDIEALVIPWGPTDKLVDDKEVDDAAFLADKRVRTLLATFKATYEQSNPAPAPTVVAEVEHAAKDAVDAVTKVLHDIKIPEWLHKPLKRLMNVDVESKIDDVENFLYPKVEKALGATAGAVLIALGALLTFVGVMSAFYVGSTAEVSIARNVMSWQEFFLLRAGGAAFNHGVVIVGGLMFAVIGIFVVLPYDKRPTKPGNDASEAEKTKFAVADDKWREGYRESLIVRVLAASWSVTIGASLVLIFGAVALAWQFQWMTVLMVVGVVFLVGLAVLWPLDDGATAILDRMVAIMRGHKISTTLFIAVIAGIVIYVPAVLTVPPTGARVGAFFVILLVALAAILPNRVIAGGPSDDKEVGDVIAKTRRVMAATLPFWVAGLALGVGFIALTGFGTSYAYHWDKECTGYESVPECSALEGGGLHTYVDNHDRWVAMRDRSARARESAHMPVGDACTVATRKVDAMERTYAEAIGSMQGGESSHGMCADMAAHREDWSDPALKEAVDACSRKAAACKE